MLHVGITGGIGSGKSIVCQVFESLGVPVFNADNAARHLMEHDAVIKQGVIDTLGPDVYRNGKLDKGKISTAIFNAPEKLRQFNALIHPATIAYSRAWMQQQTTPYVLKEAAILFESGTNKELDYIIGVTAPQELRIKRVIARSGHTREKVLAIIASQMDENEKMARCNSIITNDDLQPVIPQVLALHKALCETESH